MVVGGVVIFAVYGYEVKDMVGIEFRLKTHFTFHMPTFIHMQQIYSNTEYRIEMLWLYFCASVSLLEIANRKWSFVSRRRNQLNERL